jgi:hypothetical protein
MADGMVCHRWLLALIQRPGYYEALAQIAKR